MEIKFLQMFHSFSKFDFVCIYILYFVFGFPQGALYWVTGAITGTINTYYLLSYSPNPSQLLKCISQMLSFIFLWLWFLYFSDSHWNNKYLLLPLLLRWIPSWTTTTTKYSQGSLAEQMCIDIVSSNDCWLAITSLTRFNLERAKNVVPLFSDTVVTPLHFSTTGPSLQP